ncbi:uncharacterized protein LOC110454446 isoform X2 [Mizuhopecten yessoensis]|uniref:Uncharacterized protein n=1 Tax=Mizuhopecten yessoensis TaxID=6573 RepID=A0A210QF54_MIZYE|nr:uncharacterized protein LOC110454446 isoform X2 [Mizuhopecten yessoensis]OWF47365.1 hypothetical protein KP79_PYT01324 [Mizuhopecten yessoensis]
MGRKHKRLKSSNPELEAEKQREEIRNHILKVFRARISNPCDGGALLVGKDTKVSPSHSEHLSITSHTQNDSSSSSSMSDSDDSLRKASQGHTRTRRKRRCKRRTKRSKVTSKTQGEKSAVTRHLRAAHDVRDALHLNESVNKEQDKISLITVNRLTNKVGLFNKGRKSETISRDIQVSDSVKKKTEDDLKNILHYSDENGPPIALDIEPSSSGKKDNINPRRDEAVLSGASSKQTQLRHISEQTYIRSSVLSSGDQSRNSAKARMSITPVSEPNNKQVNSAGSCKSTSSGGLEENLPESPPYEEIAAQLMCTVKPSLVFPGRSILEETREKLQKLMRQSAPRSATPTPNLLTLGSICTGSVKRSLLERFLPEENQGSSKGYPNNAGKSEVTCMESEPNLCNIPKQQTNNTSSDIVTDAHVLLRCNDLAITQSKYQYSPNTEKSQNFNPDARQILRHNDSERAKKFITIPQPRQGEQGSDSIHMSRPPSAFRTKERDALQHQPCIHHDVSSMDTREYVPRESSHHDSQSSRHSLTSSQASSCGHPDRRTYSQVVSTNKAVVAELRHYPEHLLHTTYYRDSLDVLMPQERQHQPPMDFLDMLDDTQTVAPSPVPVNMLKSATPDSDGSPLWLPVPPPFPKKPTFDTPSPPDKLYPRLLY